MLKFDSALPLAVRQDAGHHSNREEHEDLRVLLHRIVMHPGPMNEGIEISHDVAYSGSSLIEQQVTNGVAIRMALLYLVAGVKNQ